MMAKVILSKIVCRAVTAVVEGDQVKGELTSQEIACYSPDDLRAVWDTAVADVARQNAELKPKPKPKPGKGRKS